MDRSSLKYFILFFFITMRIMLSKNEETWHAEQFLMSSSHVGHIPTFNFIVPHI